MDTYTTNTTAWPYVLYYMQKYYNIANIGWGLYPTSSGWGHRLPNGTFQYSPAPAEVASARIKTIERYGGVEIDLWCLGSGPVRFATTHGKPVDYAAYWAPWIPALKKFLAKTDDDGAVLVLSQYDQLGAEVNGTLDVPKLAGWMTETNANTLSFLLQDFDGHQYLDMVRFMEWQTKQAPKSALKIWVTLIPPTESQPVPGSQGEEVSDTVYIYLVLLVILLSETVSKWMSIAALLCAGGLSTH
jgi:hypothetical protein